MSADESIVDLLLTGAQREYAALRQAEEAERARDTAQGHAQDAEQESAMLRARIDELELRLGRFQRGGAQRILDAEQRLRAELQNELAATRRSMTALERAHDTAMSGLGVDAAESQATFDRNDRPAKTRGR
jgi:hypothetical protein